MDPMRLRAHSYNTHLLSWLDPQVAKLNIAHMQFWEEQALWAAACSGCCDARLKLSKPSPQGQGTTGSRFDAPEVDRNVFHVHPC